MSVADKSSKKPSRFYESVSYTPDTHAGLKKLTPDKLVTIFPRYVNNVERKLRSTFPGFSFTPEAVSRTGHQTGVVDIQHKHKGALKSGKATVFEVEMSYGLRAMVSPVPLFSSKPHEISGIDITLSTTNVADGTGCLAAFLGIFFAAGLSGLVSTMGRVPGIAYIIPLGIGALLGVGAAYGISELQHASKLRKDPDYEKRVFANIETAASAWGMMKEVIAAFEKDVVNASV